MALTAEDYESLRAAGLTDFFEDNRPLFTEMAENAFEYARSFVIPTGQKVRVDDVNQALEPAPRSTIVDCTTDRVRILRPGSVTAEELADVLGYQPQ